MTIQRYSAATANDFDESYCKCSIFLMPDAKGRAVLYADHVAAVEQLRKALEAYVALDHDDCTGTEWEGRCKACAAKKQATATLEAKP